jgi:hypothetical protein
VIIDDEDWPDDYPDDDECDDNEPVGSCEECEQDIYEDDCYFMNGLWLCSRCAWIADGCPEPGGTEE